ncbi:hypothetical protein LEP1GSC052_2095 [Leptospira kmetyi serovar Malaysia str. Bejo-Iso9]|nr:hypothetical protein LEP1GSC052_2095 [Leptospira kmetyi serovar Malaysia str. Bejo-Iso9]
MIEDFRRALIRDRNPRQRVLKFFLQPKRSLDHSSLRL